MGSAPRKQSKTYKVPKRPYEAARLDAELKVGFSYSSTGVWCESGIGVVGGRMRYMFWDGNVGLMRRIKGLEIIVEIIENFAQEGIHQGIG